MSNILKDDFAQISRFIEDKKSLENSRWLITGATGMIGSYLLSFLSWLNEEELNRSAQVVALYRGDIDSFHPNVGSLLKKDFIEFRKTDLSKEFVFAKDDCFSYVLHAASNASPKSYINDPIGTINTNVKALQIMLEHFKDRVGLKSFLYFSSGEVYGNPFLNDIPTPEGFLGTTDNLGFRSCYVEAKRFGETLCRNYFKQYGLPVKIVRPVHVYGPGFSKDDSRVWADFIIRAHSDKKIEILSDGKARRGFCYISDAVTQIFAVLQKGLAGEVYNVGTEEHFSIKELAELISQTSGQEVEIIIRNSVPDYLQDSPHISCPSIKKVSSLSPLMSTSLEEGIRKSVAWFKSLEKLRS